MGKYNFKTYKFTILICGEQMAHIDTLKYYDDLIAEQVPEKQARIQVHTLYSGLDGFATKEDLNVGLQNLEKDLQKLEIDLKKDFKQELSRLGWEIKIFVVYTIIGTTGLVLAPIILRHFGWQ
jgi:hypothetical protein